MNYELEWKYDERFLAHVTEVEAVVHRLLETTGEIFFVRVARGGVCHEKSYCLTGKKFLRLINQGCDTKCHSMPFVDSNPYVHAYHSSLEEMGFRSMDEYDPCELVERLNGAVANIRGFFQSQEMSQHLAKLDKAKEKRKKGAEAIIEAYRSRYARLEVLRLDLSYRKGKYVDLDVFGTALKEVKADWERFRHDLVSGGVVAGVVGYLAKLEYGLLSGFHFHIIVLCDGSKHREDITLAKMLGEHWSNKVVSRGEGRYYNCNRHKSDYRFLGIGSLNYYDNAKYDALVNLVVEYMVKTDHVMAIEAPGERIWFRSAHKASKSNKRRGRPRYFT